MARTTAILGWILLAAGLAFQSGTAQADTRDLLDHMQRQEQRRLERQDRQQMDEPRDDERRGPRHGRRGIDSGEAARRAQTRNGGGRVLGVDSVDEGYRVKLLKQGEVRTLLVPDSP